MEYCLGNGFELLSASAIFAVCQDSSVYERGTRPFYSCVLSDLALDWKRGWGDLVLIQTSLLFICRSCCSYAN